jgi:hypothetical protein
VRLRELAVVRSRVGDHRLLVLMRREALLIGWHYIAPGKPTHNAFIESFNA